MMTVYYSMTVFGATSRQSGQRLTFGADMRAAPADDQAHDGRAAARAGLVLLTVGLQRGLVVALLAAGVAVVADRGAAVGDALRQDLADGGVEARRLVVGQRVR